ncbi:ComEC/Rec2 family competence protein [Membranihabitans marinus]
MLLMHPLSEGEDPADVVRAGHRYQGLVRTSQLEQGERASAMLFPFGDQALSILPEDQWTTVTDAFSALRQATADASARALGDAPALLPGIILGDRSGQDAALTEAMRVSGLTHMTVVSGTHCTLVMGALMGLMRLLRMPRWSTVVITLLGLLLFVMLVQPAPSVIRAALMGSIGALAVFAGRGRASSALLCLCVLILLLYDPWFSTEPAFQLSVAATAGIVLIGHRLKELFEQRMPALIAGPLALACSAQLLVTPVLLPLAAGVTTYSVPANILAGPLLPLVTVPGTLAAVLSTTLPGVSQVLLWAAGVPAAGIGLIGRGASSLPQALAPWPAGWLGAVLVLLYVAAALILCRLLIALQRPGRAEMGVLVSAAASVLALIVPLTGLGEQKLPGDWRFALCDVGQGDMLVIRTGAQAGIVVDTGEEPAAAEECLNHLEIEQVEVLMITHEHRDHYGGMPGVKQAADIHRLLYSASAGWQLAEAPEAESVQVSAERAHPGDSGIHEGAFPVTWTVWAAADYHRNPNDNSLAVLFEIHEYSAGADGPANDPLRLLSTGDLEQEVTDLLLAREALPQHVDVLKVPHHGAANGGTEILEFTRPSVALIGVGEDNSYGHPAPEITGMLQRLESAVYRTDQHGTVVFSYAQGQLETSGIR